MTSIIGRAPIEGQAESHDEGGPEGNERLTAGTGALLLVLYAIEGVTILFLGQLLTAHFFVGFLLIGPVALKLASTGYRFFRYYTGHPVYKRKGPPMPLLRILGPFVVLTSVTVLATGVALGLVGPNAVAGLMNVDPRASGSASSLYGFTQMTFGAGFTVAVALWHANSATPVAARMIGA